MKSLLVALIVHLLNSPASLDAGATPIYVVPRAVFEGGEPLKLTTSNAFGEIERRKWQVAMDAMGGPKLMPDLCYRAAYKDFATGLAGMKADERDAFLGDVGGHHALARFAVRWCNVSLNRMDLLPQTHPERKRAELGIRQAAYGDDVRYLAACKGEACAGCSCEADFAPAHAGSETAPSWQPSHG